MSFHFKSAVLASLLILGCVTGCGGANYRDLEGVNLSDPDKVEIYSNIEGHPNVVRLCIDGIALLTTTRSYQPVTHIPEWDSWCVGSEK